MKATIRGTVRPPRGTPGANGVYTVDLVVEIADEEARHLAWELRSPADEGIAAARSDAVHFDRRARTPRQATTPKPHEKEPTP